MTSFRQQKQILENFDVNEFCRVPKYIVKSFFGELVYKNRIIVTMFAYMNGISIDQLKNILMITSPTCTLKMRLTQIEKLWHTIESGWRCSKPFNKWTYDNNNYKNYYSFVTITNDFRTIDGRKFHVKRK